MLTTTLIVGFVLGLMSALFFALYMVPQKIYKVDPTTYLWTMGLGVLLTALIPYAALGFPQHSTLPQKIACILCGVVWGLGTRFFAAGISCFGLALATPIKNTTGVFGTLVGLILFQEWRTTNPWLGCAGSALIVLAAIIIGLTGDRTASKNRTAAGVGYSLLAALFYASYLYPLKAVVSKIGYWEFTPWYGGRHPAHRDGRHARPSGRGARLFSLSAARLWTGVAGRRGLDSGAHLPGGQYGHGGYLRGLVVGPVEYRAGGLYRQYVLSRSQPRHSSAHHPVRSIGGHTRHGVAGVRKIRQWREKYDNGVRFDHSALPGG